MMKANSVENELRFTTVSAIASLQRMFGIRVSQGFVNRFLYPKEFRERFPKDVSIRYDKDFILQLNTRSWIEWCVYLN